MIKVTRLNGQEITINAELIEAVEACPNTVISLATNNRYLVKETVDEVVGKVIEYRKRVNAERPVRNPIEGYKRE
ncbi:MAG: flagellar FlbD family protein [Elusimicrobia bacterium]|nr:flagellar FlbD family protein [Elusimicrobiota bacterium]